MAMRTVPSLLVLLARPRPSKRLADLYALYRSRRALARLDGARLQDIGVHAKEAAAESQRPVWDVPDHWRD